MTWRSCSPPWPGRQNPVSWPGRRQCGLPSAERPLRSASRPLPGGQGGAGGPAGQLVPEPGWPRRWSRQWLGWAASLRPTRTYCPAPFSSWPTSRWRRRPRVALACPSPPPRQRGTPGRVRLRRRAARPAAGRTIRRAPRRPPARRNPRGRTTSRYAPHPVTVPPNRPAAPIPGPRRASRRRNRLLPARRHPGPRVSTAPASRRGRDPSPRSTRTFPEVPARAGSWPALRLANSPAPGIRPHRGRLGERVRRWPLAPRRRSRTASQGQ